MRASSRLRQHELTSFGVQLDEMPSFKCLKRNLFGEMEAYTGMTLDMSLRNGADHTCLALRLNGTKHVGVSSGPGRAEC